jgi:Tfp pilus assembly protein PilN
MRPINLIPPEERRGQHAPLRSGPLAYILVGALVAVLAGVTAVVLVGNQVDEREAEVASLEREDAAAAAKAERLAAYVQFRDLREERTATVSSLADSRFDWERVMRELSLVLPSNTWLVELTASAAPGVGVGGGSTVRSSIPGPALELTGCTTGQKQVAGFVAALKDIDGVTRVAVETSELPEQAEESAGGGATEGGDECRTREFIAKFEIVVAFDAAPVPPTSSGGQPAAAAPEAEDDGEGEGEGESQNASTSGEEGEG